MTTNAADKFRALCVTLVLNYPRLLWRPSKMATLTSVESSELEWSLRTDYTQVQLYLERYLASPHLCGVVASMVDVETLAGAQSRSCLRRVAMWSHPAITRLVQIWPGQWRSHQSKIYIKSQVHSRRHNSARRGRHSYSGSAVEAGLTRHRARQGLVDRRAQDPRKLESTALAPFQIKSNRLSGWDSTKGARGCLHPGCEGTSGCDTAHIMWECPAAQKVWAWTTAA